MLHTASSVLSMSYEPQACSVARLCSVLRLRISANVFSPSTNSSRSASALPMAISLRNSAKRFIEIRIGLRVHECSFHLSLLLVLAIIGKRIILDAQPACDDRARVGKDQSSGSLCRRPSKYRSAHGPKSPSRCRFGTLICHHCILCRSPYLSWHLRWHSRPRSLC